jgi:glycosyltransferase involved in cell wall biosynthesis
MPDTTDTAAHTPIRLGIFYPADPAGGFPGGIATFLRGIISTAPDDIEVSVIGMSTDAAARPPGRWSTLELQGKRFRFFPIYATRVTRQPRIPAVVRFMTGLALRPGLRRGFDVVEFHRIEPVALFMGDSTPATAVFHQNMDVLHNEDSDIRWKHLPGAYFAMESRLMQHLRRVFVVRENAVTAYQQQFPALADRFAFTPTWVDPFVFNPLADGDAEPARRALRESLALAPDTPLLITAGRMESQKDPVLMVEAFARLCEQRGATAPRPALVMVGDGALRNRIAQRAEALGIGDRVIMPGMLPAERVAEHLRCADLFVLSSEYEGMPMALLEALGCGLPVVSTDVGEVNRVLHDDVNGRLVAQRTAQALADALAEALDKRERYRGQPCLDAVADYTPAAVLPPLYENYRRLAGRLTS